MGEYYIDQARLDEANPFKPAEERKVVQQENEPRSSKSIALV